MFFYSLLILFSFIPNLNGNTEKTKLMKPLPQRKAQRLKGYDYATNNRYFITTNVKNFIKCLGVVYDNKMHLNVYGEIVHQQIQWIEQRYSYAKIHSLVVMPDHVHFVLEIHHLLAEENAKIKSVSELVGAFKTTSSKQIRRGGYPNFQWHRSFHDRIIRDDFELIRIEEYIFQNPKRWKGK